MEEQGKMDIETIGSLLDENKRQAERIKELERIIESLVDYKSSALFREWQEYITRTPTNEQVDFYIYQQQSAIKALKG